MKNDLAAAFVEIAYRVDDSYSLFFATNELLAESERLSQDVELRFNLAVAWDLLGVTTEAVAAWQAFLDIDSSPDWAAEAESRLNKLTALSAGAGGHAEEHSPRSLVTTRRRVFRRLLPAWAEAISRGEERTASIALAEAARISLASGDHLALGSVDVIEKALGEPRRGPVAALARAHALLGAGISHAWEFETAKALAPLSEAQRVFSELKSPAALLAEYHAGMAHYHVERYVDAQVALANVTSAATKQNESLLSGLSLKGLALIEQVTGNPSAAAELYQEASVEVERSGDLLERTKLASIKADGLLSAQRDREAWRLLHGSIRSAWRHPSDEVRYVVAAATAVMAEKRGFLHLAAVMWRLSLDASTSIESPARLADAATWYARSLVPLGRLEDAAQELSRVREGMDGVQDAATLKRASADYGCVEGRRALSEGHPDAALPLLREAADYYESAGLLTHAAPCRAAQGSALLELGNLNGAVDVLSQSLALSQRLDGFVSSPERYWGASDPTLELLESILILHLERGDGWAALELADQALGGGFSRPGMVPEEGSAPSLLELAADRGQGAAPVLVVYSLRDRVALWILDQGRLSSSEVALGRSDLVGRVQRFIEVVQDGRPGWREELRELGLGTALLGSIPDTGDTDKPLFIVPSREVAMIPWGLLELNQHGSLLVENRPITLAADIRTAVLLSEAGPSASRASILVVADPAIEAPFGLSDLPHAAEESAAIHTMFPTSSTLLMGRMATKDRVVQSLRDHSTVHFALHGVLDPYRPGRSHLLLGNAEGNPEPLTAGEIRDLDLEAVDLVVLSACDASFRSTVLASHALGLAEAFRSAGARAVVASTWSVDDLATRRLMERFYGNLATGAPVAHALREAQLVDLDNRVHTNLAFHLLGDPGITLH